MRKQGSPPRPGGAVSPAPRPPVATPALALPSPRELIDPRLPWLLPALAMIGTRLVVWRSMPFAAEDAYITFRYARSLANGTGLVFNPGERVFGFSSPLWALWMAAGFRLGMAPVLWSRITNLVAELTTLTLIVAMLRRQTSNVSAWCFAVFLVAWFYFGAVAASGMETTSLMTLIVLAAAAAAGRSRWAGPALATVALTRPEGLVAAGVLCLWARGRDRLVGALLAAAGIAALWFYYGSPIPQSLVAKSQLYGTPGPWSARYWWEWLSPFIFGRFTDVSEFRHLFLMSVVFAPAVVVGARELWWQRRSALAAVAAACLAVWFGYSLLGVAYFWWYLVVPLGGFAVLAAVGFPRVVRGRSVYVAMALFLLGMWTVAPRLYSGRAIIEAMSFGHVGDFLARNARLGEKALMEPIGMIGYAAPVIVVDEVGLVSPYVVRRRLGGPGWYADVVARERPDWLVARQSLVRESQMFAGSGVPFRSPAERDSVMAHYTQVASGDSASLGSTLLVFRRSR